MSNHMDTAEAVRIILWQKAQQEAVMYRMWRFLKQVIWGMANKDLAALSLWLGDKQFFHGARPSSLDCTVFGHLAQFLFIDIGFPQKVSVMSCPMPPLSNHIVGLSGKPLPKSCDL